MLRFKPTEHLTGVTIQGDLQDFYELTESIYRITGIVDDPTSAYYGVRNTLLAICYDIRHAYMGDRDIFTVENHDRIKELFPTVDKMMLGRGILANPGLIHEIKNNALINKEMLEGFHEEIFQSYREFFGDDKYALFRMKELWGYMIYIFSNSKAYSMEIKKSQNIDEYNEAVSKLLEEQEIVAGAGLFTKQD